MPRGKHCDDPSRIEVGGRFDPELEEPIWSDITEGMCTVLTCDGSDMKAWQNRANREFLALERQLDELKKALIIKFGNMANVPDQFKSVMDNALIILDAWERSWKKWEPGYEEYWRKTLGFLAVNSWAKAHVRDIINQFRDAACAYDEVALATSEVGGYIPPAEKEAIKEEEEEKKKGEAWGTAATVAALGVAGFFTYKIVSKK